MGQVKFSKNVSKVMENMAAPEKHKSRASVGHEKKLGEYFYIKIDQLMPYSDQARINFNDKELDELSDSIKNLGVLQPLQIVSNEDKNGSFFVISGERRLRAAKKCGLEKVPCIIVKNSEKASEIALVENIQRVDLHPIELARAYRELIKIKKTQASVAESLGVSPQSVCESLKLLDIPEDIQDELIKKNISSREALRKVVKEKKINTSVNKKPAFRISFEEGQLKIKESNLSDLNKKQKKELRAVLLKIARSLKI